MRIEGGDFATSRLRTPIKPCFRWRIWNLESEICANNGAECTPRTLRVRSLRPLLGPRSSRPERLSRFCMFWKGRLRIEAEC
eukprot:14065353-Alexandrium_andersonii.AAC.1